MENHNLYIIIYISIAWVGKVNSNIRGRKLILILILKLENWGLGKKQNYLKLYKWQSEFKPEYLYINFYDL